MAKVPALAVLMSAGFQVPVIRQGRRVAGQAACWPCQLEKFGVNTGMISDSM